MIYLTILLILNLFLSANRLICPLPYCEAKEERTFSDTHQAVDLEALVGTPVYAAMAGSVYSSGWNYMTDPPAIAITLLHDGGYFATNYWHLSRALVSEGEHVYQGQLIGYTGLTGTTSWPHLHFSVQDNRVHVDPANYVYIYVIGDEEEIDNQII